MVLEQHFVTTPWNYVCTIALISIITFSRCRKWTCIKPNRVCNQTNIKGTMEQKCLTDATYNNMRCNQGDEI